MIRHRLIGLAVLAFAGPLEGQKAGAIRGTIVAVANGERLPVTGARISLIGTAHSRTTGSNGAFHFADLDPGQYLIQASAIGYSTMTSPLQLKERETLDIEFEAIAEAVSLPELSVEERANHGPADWLRRKSEGRGRYIGRALLEERHTATIPDALRMVAGVRIECRSGNVCVARMARAPRGCSPAYFMDGIPADPAVVWLTPVAEIEGIEIYSGPAETPPELESGQARCGVIALWTRPPPPRRPKEKKTKVDTANVRIQTTTEPPPPPPAPPGL